MRAFIPGKHVAAAAVTERQMITIFFRQVFIAYQIKQALQRIGLMRIIARRRKDSNRTDILILDHWQRSDLPHGCTFTTRMKFIKK